MTLQQLGEDKLLARLLPSLPRNARVVVGAGDDCAMVRFPHAKELLLLKTDCVVAGVHFAVDAPADRVGWKAIMRPLSDFAAMSGLPEFALITLVLPKTTNVAWLRQFYRGARRAAAHFGVVIVGGELSASAGPIVVSVSVNGHVSPQRCVLRSGGKIGDDLYVTGRLGGSMPSRHLNFLPRIFEARWLTRNFPIHAMMDLSDGLGADLPRLARASVAGFFIAPALLPRHRGCSIAQAIGDGEDYELLLAAPRHIRARLEKKWRRQFPRLLLTRIGQLVPQSQSMKLSAGYDHFQQRQRN
ncbi:MAG: thiamine-phosphate kinase [Verrucomicrobiota bacterium]|nr:thiamine-phosphate kinase [Verrucomicrobiota bacterium]